MEPVTTFLAISSYVISNTLLEKTLFADKDNLLTFVLKGAVGGLIEGRAENLWEFSRQKFQDWRKILAAPENHDLLKAVRKSYLEATIILCDARLEEIAIAGKKVRKALAGEEKFIEAVKSDFSKELLAMKRGDYTPPFLEAINKIENLMPLRGKTAAQKSDELRKKVNAQLLNELKSILSRIKGSTLGLSQVTLPARLEEMVSEGWKDAESSSQSSKVDWFDLLCLFFAEEIKHNDAVAKIFQTQLLIEIRREGQAQYLNLKEEIEKFGDSIRRELDAMEKRLALRLLNLRTQLSELKENQKKGFEGLQTRLDQTNATLRILTSSLTVARVIRRVPLYEKLAKDGIAFSVDDYITKKGYRSLFVGRERYFEQIDDFISQNRNGLMSITAPAGFGKSALLANWIEQKKNSDQTCFIAYHFFSVRDDVIRTLTGCLYNMLRQIYVYHGERYEQLPVDENSLKLALANIVRQRGAHKCEPLIIALDGLDEADKEFSPLFALPLPDGVHVIALWRAGLEASSIYLQDWKVNSTHLTLDRLPREAIPEWLRKTGNQQIVALADDESFITRLDEETQGFPLYLHYLVEDLIETAEKGDDPRQFINWSPEGLTGYVERQLNLLGQQNKDVEQMFYLLSVTAGPLSRAELLSVTGLDEWDIIGLPRNLARWFSILEQQDETNYSFAHPRLADEFKRALGDDARRSLDRLLSDCASWKDNYARSQRRGSQYALLHYAGHLREEKRWNELFALAADESYSQTQAEAFPESPDLPLKTLQTAILASADKDDGAAIAGFMFAHARRVREITNESPLEALKRGQLERAWLLADQHDPDRRALWYLLLVWELEEKERLDESQATLKGLIGAKLPRLSGWMSSQAAYLIYKVYRSGSDILRKLMIELLSDGGRKEICGLLASDRRIAEAFEVVELIDNSYPRAAAMSEIAKAQAAAGLTEQAVLTAQSILTDRNRHLPEIAMALVEVDGNYFKRLLVPCAYYIDSCYKICGRLARVYPQQGDAIAAFVRGQA